MYLIIYIQCIQKFKDVQNSVHSLYNFFFSNNVHKFINIDNFKKYTLFFFFKMYTLFQRCTQFFQRTYTIMYIQLTQFVKKHKDENNNNNNNPMFNWSFYFIYIKCHMYHI